MPDKTAAEKMRMKAGMSAAFINAPSGTESKVGMPEGVILTEDPDKADFLLLFASTQAEAEGRLRAIKPHVTEKTLAWLAYPKGSKAAGRDLNRDTVWSYAQTIGLDLVANVAIDETWSALRLRPGK